MSTMSQPVPQTDLSLFGVGTIGKVNLASTLAKIPYDPSIATDATYHLRIYNDSGSTLQIFNDTGTIGDYVPAGAWPTYELEVGSSSITFKVISILPNPPIQLLMMTIFGPGEKVPDTPQLGNSPVGIGGTIQTSSVQTLSNEGNAKTQLVIDIGDSALAQLITINNDGTATWKVDVGSVAHTILAIASAANFLKIGQAGDTVEALGKLTVDQLLTAAAGLNVTASGLTVTGGIATDTITASSTLGVTGEATVGDLKTNVIRDNVTGVDQVDLATAGLTFNNPIILASGAAAKLLAGAGINLLDATSTHDLFINAPNAGGTGAVRFTKGGVDTGVKIDNNAVNWPNGNFLPNISFFTGSGSGTYNHTFGSAPFWVAPIVDVVGSATQGYDTVTATQVHVTLGAVLAFKAFCG